MIARFTIPGEPNGKGRHRTTKAGRTYTPAKTVRYEKLVRIEYAKQCGAVRFEQGDPLDVRILAYFTIPKSVSKKKLRMMLEKILRPTKKPDWDNIGKIVCDSLNGVAYHDDAQIVDAQVRKFYSDNPRVVVTIQNAKVKEDTEEDSKNETERADPIPR